MNLTLRDDLGRLIILPGGPARRIVSLTPEVTENLFALGAGAQVVGVTSADTYPPSVKYLPKVGGFGQPNFEAVRALRPDVVIAASATIPAGEADMLQKRFGGIPVYQQKSVRFADVPRHLTQLGQLTGHSAEAKRLCAVIDGKAAQAARRVAGKPRVTVFVEVSPSPLYAAGPGSFVDDLIQRAGGSNVVTGSNPFPLYSKEALLVADPAYYIISVGDDMNPNANSQPASLPASLAQRLKAVRTGHVYRIPGDLLFRPTPRLADGLVLLARTLHP